MKCMRCNLGMLDHRILNIQYYTNYICNFYLYIILIGINLGTIYKNVIEILFIHANNINL